MSPDKKKYLSGNLDQMALSLSGGGVRAVGFHLGTMSMLRRLGLIQNIQILSSVSGGSMLGIGYSLAQQFDRSFQDFFDDFYEFLPQLNILEEFLGGLASRLPASPSGRRDMITILANVYDEGYFQQFYGEYVKDGLLTFDVLMNQSGKSHLKEMIFNATEFKTGTAFRFQVSEFRCLIGNGNVSLCRNHAAKIRIADIMAASSCIPVGMEPLFFPDDFRWPDDPAPKKWGKNKSRPTNQEIRDALSRNTNTKEPTIALMDGGVYDNQGITSTLLAMNRRKPPHKTEHDTHECGVPLGSSGRGEPPGPEDWAKWMTGGLPGESNYEQIKVEPEDLDLLIISDTPVRKASFFPKVLFSKKGEPEWENAQDRRNRNKKGIWRGIKSWLARRITVGRINKFALFLLMATFISAYSTLEELTFWISNVDMDWSNPFEYVVIVQFFLLPLLLTGLTGLGIISYYRFKRKAIKKLKRIIPHWEKSPGKYINKLRLTDLKKMGILRASSTAALTSTIYMDRIRGLGYSTVYARDDLKKKILANEIYSLLKERDPADAFHSMLTDHEAWPPPEELSEIVGVAATMPTALWINHKKGDPLSDLDYLVVCGQASICYNLMKYLWEELREADGTWIDSKMKPVFENTLKQWKKLMLDPLSLLKDRKRKSRLPEQKKHAEELEA